MNTFILEMRVRCVIYLFFSERMQGLVVTLLLIGLGRAQDTQDTNNNSTGELSLPNPKVWHVPTPALYVIHYFTNLLKKGNWIWLLLAGCVVHGNTTTGCEHYQRRHLAAFFRSPGSNYQKEPMSFPIHSLFPQYSRWFNIFTVCQKKVKEHWTGFVWKNILNILQWPFILIIYCL